jgi:hypothetical protein
MIAMGSSILPESYRARTAVDISAKGSVLTIGAARTEDGGQYKCSLALPDQRPQEIIHTVTIRGNVYQRVGRVLSFFSSRWNWNSPSPAGECAPPPPPLVPGGEGHTRLRGVPIPTRGHTLWYRMYSCLRKRWVKRTLRTVLWLQPHMWLTCVFQTAEFFHPGSKI